MTLQFISVFLGTFVLEDAALVSALALVSQHQLTWMQAFWACFLGISLGDLLVYLVGYLASCIQIENAPSRFGRFVNWFRNFKFKSSLGYMIVASRAIPGTRLPTYLLAGYVRYSFLRFFILTFLSVLAWVIFALSLGRSAQQLISDHWVYSTLLFFALIVVVRSYLSALTDIWQRRALLYTWRKWLSFEFWPAWLFYLPIIPRYIFLSLKYRSFFLPFYSNPHIAHAGFVGESKWDFYQYLQNKPFSLKTQLLKFSDARDAEIQRLLETREFTFPFILKPDQGQRGFAVRIIKSELELKEYLAEAQFDLLIQAYSQYSCEAGVFYYRLPDQPNGEIFSITDKRFPFVMGNGVNNIGELILQDARARIIAPTYFGRFENHLNDIPQGGEKIMLSTCGNHCQGAIFLNGQHLRTSELLNSIEQVAKQIPNFYFGRFDIRYASPEQLKAGQAFEIVEVNGAGSEATHIWDEKTTLSEAYSVLYAQWGLIFKIGYQVKKMQLVQYKFSFARLVRDLFSMSRQNKNLSTSS